MCQTWREKNFLINEEDFETKMQETVLPLLKADIREEYFTSSDGSRIHTEYMINPEEKAAIVISHGFCEFAGKYHEMMYYMYKCGYSVFFIDHRGHGYSDKCDVDPDMVYVKSFQEYVDDFADFIEHIVKKRSRTGKLYLFAHSMGGAIAAMYLEQFPDTFEKAVLSSPMIEMRYGSYSMIAVRALMLLSVVLHWQKKYMPGQHGFDNVNVYETSSAISRSRYEYAFALRQSDKHFQTYGGSYSWGRAGMAASAYIKKHAGDIRTPILLLQAGNDSLVRPEAQDYFVKHTANTSFIRYEDSKHEIFNAGDETRYRYYDDVFTFFNA